MLQGLWGSSSYAGGEHEVSAQARLGVLKGIAGPGGGRIGEHDGKAERRWLLAGMALK